MYIRISLLFNFLNDLRHLYASQINDKLEYRERKIKTWLKKKIEIKNIYMQSKPNRQKLSIEFLTTLIFKLLKWCIAFY